MKLYLISIPYVNKQKQNFFFFYELTFLQLYLVLASAMVNGCKHQKLDSNWISKRRIFKGCHRSQAAGDPGLRWAPGKSSQIHTAELVWLENGYHYRCHQAVITQLEPLPHPCQEFNFTSFIAKEREQVHLLHYFTGCPEKQNPQVMERADPWTPQVGTAWVQLYEDFSPSKYSLWYYMMRGWLNLWMQNHRYRRADCKVIHEFLTAWWGSVPLTSIFFRVSYIYEREIYFKNLAHGVMVAWCSQNLTG